MKHEVDEHFDIYLIAKEFPQYPIEEIEKWPLARLLAFKAFLSQFYEIMTPRDKAKEHAFHFK